MGSRPHRRLRGPVAGAPPRRPPAAASRARGDVRRVRDPAAGPRRAAAARHRGRPRLPRRGARALAATCSSGTAPATARCSSWCSATSCSTPRRCARRSSSAAWTATSRSSSRPLAGRSGRAARDPRRPVADRRRRRRASPTTTSARATSSTSRRSASPRARSPNASWLTLHRGRRLRAARMVVRRGLGMEGGVRHHRPRRRAPAAIRRRRSATSPGSRPTPSPGASGARLPTEVEWEKAATWDQRTRQRLEALTGSVWQWTASEFTGYPGFVAHPYREYSEVFFDRGYRVLRGGSWATRDRASPRRRSATGTCPNGVRSSPGCASLWTPSDERQLRGARQALDPRLLAHRRARGRAAPRDQASSTGQPGARVAAPPCRRCAPPAGARRRPSSRSRASRRRSAGGRRTARAEDGVPRGGAPSRGCGPARLAARRPASPAAGRARRRGRRRLAAVPGAAAFAAAAGRRRTCSGFAALAGSAAPRSAGFAALAGRGPAASFAGRLGRAAPGSTRAGWRQACRASRPAAARALRLGTRARRLARLRRPRLGAARPARGGLGRPAARRRGSLPAAPALGHAGHARRRARERGGGRLRLASRPGGHRCGGGRGGLGTPRGRLVAARCDRAGRRRRRRRSRRRRAASRRARRSPRRRPRGRRRDRGGAPAPRPARIESRSASVGATGRIAATADRCRRTSPGTRGIPGSAEVVAQVPAAQGGARAPRPAPRGSRGTGSPGRRRGQQRRARLEHERLDLARAHAEHAATSDVRQVAELGQQQRRALVVGQPREVGEELAQVLAPLDLGGEALGRRDRRRRAGPARRDARATARRSGCARPCRARRARRRHLVPSGTCGRRRGTCAGRRPRRRRGRPSMWRQNDSMPAVMALVERLERGTVAAPGRRRELGVRRAAPGRRREWRAGELEGGGGHPTGALPR